jgi:hypothetical protein
MPSLLCVMIVVIQHTTQWFERARFECHPNNPSEYRVLLGLLSNGVRQNPCPGFLLRPVQFSTR